MADLKNLHGGIKNYKIAWFFPNNQFLNWHIFILHILISKSHRREEFFFLLFPDLVNVELDGPCN